MKNKIKLFLPYIRSFHFNSIFFKNLILIIIAMLIPLTTAYTVFYFNLQKAAKAEISSISQGNVITIKSITDTILRSTEILTVQTALNKDVQSLCMPIAKQNPEITKTYRDIQNYISGFTNVYPYINSIYIYSEELGIVIENQQILSVEDHEDSNWIPYYESTKSDKPIIISRKKLNQYPYFISIMKTVNINGFGKVGCVIVNIDTEELYNSISNVDDAISTNFVMLDADNKILFSNDYEKIGTTFIKGQANKFQNEFGHLKLENRKFIYAKRISSHYDITYLLLLPETHYNNIVLRPSVFLVLTLCMILIIGLIISIIFSIKMYNPIQNIMDVLSPVSSLEIYEKVKQDEITYIIETIKNTLIDSHRLSEELNQRILLLKEAQSYALQTQINPHFMHNTLEAINWSAISKLGEKNTISEMIKSLSALLDISLNTEHYLIPLEEELRHTNIYVYIMSLNYGPDIRFIWNLEEGISQYKIIKLSLQPILENAIVHGINPNRGKGSIVINGCFHNDGILITITDDGVGMKEDELLKLQEELKSDSIHGKHIGIKNVNQRIKLIFGEKYGLSINSKKGEGTSVELFIPKAEI